MKILARVNDEKYFVEISTEEIARMNGLDSYWDLPHEPEVGDDIPVEIISRAARILKRLDDERIAVILKDLDRATEAVKVIQETTQALTLFDTIKEAE